MIEIFRATEKDSSTIVNLGKVSVTEAHKDSCSADILHEYVITNYNNDAITKELADPTNIYHILSYNNEPVGFSKIVFNAKHASIDKENVTKLDRIYLLKEFHGAKLGYELLTFNIELAKKNNQAGLWLYTWIGNKKAINFYLRAGFTIIGNHDFLVAKNHYNPNHHMFLDLAKYENR